MVDSCRSVSDGDNLRPVEDACLQLPGSDFLRDCTDHALMSETELTNVTFNYIVTVGKALENRFPDMNFILGNNAFVNPSLRKLQDPNLPDLLRKFQTVVLSSLSKTFYHLR